MQKAARAAGAKARNQDQASLETLFTLTPPISPPEKRKGPQRIKAPRQIEVDDSGQPIIDMGFIAREFAMLGLPHSDPGDLLVYRRTNGKFEFRVTADVDSFLPYGMYPPHSRSLGSHVATQIGIHAVAPLQWLLFLPFIHAGDCSFSSARSAYVEGGHSASEPPAPAAVDPPAVAVGVACASDLGGAGGAADAGDRGADTQGAGAFDALAQRPAA